MPRSKRAGVRLVSWLIVSLCMSSCGLFLALGADTASLTKPDLTGLVRDQDNKSLPCARVFIYTAGPKIGIGIYVPRVMRIAANKLPRTTRGISKSKACLLFRILVVSKGFQPEFVSKIDPAVRPIEVRLTPSRRGQSPDRQMKGKVINSERQTRSGLVSQ